jgi:tRNA (guanine37-N1)-methyltransferase
MRFDILTIFPEAFASYLSSSIMGRAIRAGHVSVNLHDIRAAATDRHHTVDDRPYGGGVGMLMKVEPIWKTLKHVPKKGKRRIVLLSAKGKTFTQRVARNLTRYDQVILICPRYEGVDERVVKLVDEEISIGEYVLTGGELPALVMMDAVSRLLPGVLGKDASSKDESHSTPGVLEYPQYTRPENFRGAQVPKVLLSGNHTTIAAWRAAKRKTRKRS